MFAVGFGSVFFQQTEIAYQPKESGRAERVSSPPCRAGYSNISEVRPIRSLERIRQPESASVVGVLVARATPLVIARGVQQDLVRHRRREGVHPGQCAGMIRPVAVR